MENRTLAYGEMMRTFVNDHERTIGAPADQVGALLATLGQPEDLMWPMPAWGPMLLDGPVGMGARGGHGPIRYEVSAYEPGELVRFSFEPRVGIDGYHEFSVVPLSPDRCVLRHLLTGRLRGRMRVLMPLVIEPLHDALVEDLLDRAEFATTGRTARPARWSQRVRSLRRFTARRPRAVPVPERARLARGAFDQVDLVDAWQLARSPGMPSDPRVWADAIFHDPPPWVSALMGLRQLLVGFVGIDRGDRSAFDTLQVDGSELLLGTDASHLDFRASVLIDPRTVTLTTVARAKNRRGKAYLAVIDPIHPRVVRAMLRRAGQRLRDEAPLSELSNDDVLAVGGDRSGA